MSSMYFYVPGSMSAEDQALCLTSGEYRGRYSGKTLAEYKVEYPSITLIPETELVGAITDSAKQPVTEIDAVTFMGQLEIMYPINWNTFDGLESFMLREMYTMDVTNIYAKVRIADSVYRFFTLRDSVSLSPSEIKQRCLDFMAA